MRPAFPFLVLLAVVSAAGAQPSPDDGTWIGHPPFERVQAAGVYDPRGQRFLVFGGEDALAHDDLWSLSLGGTSQWTKLEPQGARPSPRADHTLVYDSVGDRLILFGGVDPGRGVFFDDVWVLPLAGNLAWTRVSAGGGFPQAREGHAAVFDSAGDRMIVFGGYAGGAPLTDVWALSLEAQPTWTRLAPEGSPPAGRYGHAAAWDASRRRMLVMGGYGGFDLGTLQDVWALSLDGTPRWDSVATQGTGPRKRSGHRAIYDAIRDRMIVCCGYDGTSFLNDTWALEAKNNQWVTIDPLGPRPAVRHGCAAALDEADQRLIVFGGLGSTDGPWGDTWALSLDGCSCWREIVTVPAGPNRRSNHALVYDSASQSAWLFGGYSNDVWRLSLSDRPTWVQEHPSGTLPPGRGALAGVYDSDRDRMIVFGGGTQSQLLNDLWALDLGPSLRWEAESASGAAPEPRAWPFAIYDPGSQRMLVHAGQGAQGQPLGDLWELDLAGTPTWRPLEASGASPSARYGEQGILDPVRNRVLIYGGFDGAWKDDLWSLTLSNPPAWSLLQSSGAAPGPRAYGSGVYDPTRRRMILFGGLDGPDVRADAWALALDGDTVWSPLAPAGGVPMPRAQHAAVWDFAHDRMAVFGGWGLGPRPINLDDLWTLEWQPRVSAPEPGGGTPCPLALEVGPTNPLTSASMVRFSLPEDASVRLSLYDVGGRLRARWSQARVGAGVHQVGWATLTGGTRMGGGIYFCELMAGPRRLVRRIAVVR